MLRIDQNFGTVCKNMVIIETHSQTGGTKNLTLERPAKQAIEPSKRRDGLFFVIPASIVW